MWNAGFKHDRLLPMIDSLVGASICSLIAVLASTAANGHTWRTMVPLLFISVLLFVSLIFGSGAGVLGTVLATVIFAVLLFNTKGSIQVADEAARANLAWMLLLGVSLSFLLGPASAAFRRH
jgi:K+-sensing histidine kinase KdpD